MRTAIAAAFLVLAATPALAQQQDAGDARSEQSGGILMRCEERGGELSCRRVEEQRDRLLNSELKALRERVDSLEKRVHALESRGNVPLEQEFEQSLNLMERFFRRFVDIVKGLEEDKNPPASEPQSDRPAPERT